MAQEIIIFSEYETESPNRKAQKCPQQFGHHFLSQKLIFLAIVGPQIFPELTLLGKIYRQDIKSAPGR